MGPFFMIFYGIVSKDNFMEGEWLDEPDLEVWDPGYDNLVCITGRHKGGHLCGYVGVSNVMSNSVSHLTSCDVYCHGGLTFSGPNPINHLLHGGEYSWLNSYYYVGFDCAHGGDLCFLNKDICGIRMKMYDDEIYRNWDYVKDQCQNMAHELHVLMASQVG